VFFLENLAAMHIHVLIIRELIELIVTYLCMALFIVILSDIWRGPNMLLQFVNNCVWDVVAPWLRR